MAFATTALPSMGPGSRPIRTVNLMADPGVSLSIGEAFQRGAATAHRGINYVHTDWRNFGPHRSSALAKVGR